MNKVIYILGFLCLFGFSLCAQNEDLMLYEHPRTIPQSYSLFYQSDSLSPIDSIHQQLSKKEQELYICNYKEQLKYFAENGLIYFNWDPVDKYLNDLLLKITPDSLKNKLYSKVFVKRDVSNNAISMPNGHIYINVGLLAKLKTEAALAFIIAHEYAHYLKKHHLKNYKQSNEKNRSTYYRFMHTNKHFEIEADEIALKLLHEKNISVKDAIDVFQLLKGNNKAYNLNSMRLYFVNKQVNQLLKQQQQQTSSNFSKISHLCKNEFLSLLLENGHYLSCIKFGLTISDEDNDYSSAYFTAEAIRRYLLLHPGNADKSIDTLMVEKTVENCISTFDSIGNNILQKKITTLFEELISVNNKAHQPELYFTGVLYNMQYPEKRFLIKNDLKNYMQKEHLNYALLAENLLHNEQLTINEPGVKKQVLLVDIANSFKKAGCENNRDFEKRSILSETILDKLKQWLYAKYSDRKIVFINDLVNTEFNTANNLRDFFSVIDTSLIDSANTIFYLKPGTYELFDSLDTSSIQYLEVESKVDAKLKRDNVFNPLSIPKRVNYLIKEKNTFSLKRVYLGFNENIKVEKKEYKGKLKLNKIISAFERMID